MSFGVGTIIPLAAFMAYVVLLSVVGRTPRSPMRRPLAAYLLAMAGWSFFSFMTHLNSPLLSPRRWVRLMGVACTLAPWSIFYFSTAFLGVKNQRRWLWATLVLGLLVAALGLTTGLMVQEAQVVDGRLEYKFGPGLVASALYNYSMLILSLVYLIQAYRRTRDLEIRNRIVYPALGIALILVGLQTNFTVLGQYASDIGFNLVNALLLAYAISRYHLADIYTGFRSGIAITITAMTVAAMYTALVIILQVLLEMSIGSSGLVAALLTSFFVALMLQPLRNGIQRLVERLFGSRPYDYQHILWEASQAINQSLA
ncbi:MAG: histidine kinase N-terminal 7TM domain-containing protein, partial [Chloroflexota bacterium]